MKKIIWLQFNNTPLVLKQNNYTMKILNDYIVYDLDISLKNPLRKFILKNILLGVTNIA